MLSDLIKMGAMVALIIAILAAGPWLVIWSMNTLFPVLAIEFSLSTWAAVVILAAAIRANITVKRKD